MANSYSHWKRFINWFCFNVLIASLALFTVWIVRKLNDKDAIEIASDFPEMLFLILVACLSTVTDIKARKKTQHDEIKFLILEYMLTLGAIASSILYGLLRFATASKPNFQIQPTLFWLILTAIVCLFIISVVTQVFITKSENTFTEIAGKNNKN